MTKHYFFCGIGGSGMMPLALILHARGAKISGSDRSYDQGKTPEKFDKLKKTGVVLQPQDGTGVESDVDVLVVTGAIESTVPDVKAAKENSVQIKSRAEILAGLLNDFDCGVSVAGTSGKSTVTGMIATIMAETGRDPTVMNGGIIENFSSDSKSPFPNMRTGDSDIFVTETCESDGLIALYNPYISVLNNIALDHMPLDELQTVFLDFLNRTRGRAVLNLDNDYIREMLPKVDVPVTAYAINHQADLRAENIAYYPDGVTFDVNGQEAHLKVPGEHNVSNALAALSAAQACGVDLTEAIKALANFTGIRRRMQVVGTRDNITVIDDFGHNPDKIDASLKMLKEFQGRLIIMFQMHGFGPIKLMGDEIIESFVKHLNHNDQLIMPEVYYAGGTVDRSKTAKDMIALAQEKGITAQWFKVRSEAKQHILQAAQAGDRIVIMGARDETLTDFAKEILASV